MANFIKTTDQEERIATGIVNASYKVHKELGPGLLERIYEVCLIKELEKSGYNICKQKEFPIIYAGDVLKDKLRIDLLINDLVIVELKSVDIIFPVWRAQVISYLKLTNKNLGFLINFNVPTLNEGITRIRRT
ncbi:MAG: GxxExxY protein [Bacteroidetes bacterium]|nr:GxxExxY protein [Bacteroidota bacterium]